MKRNRLKLHIFYLCGPMDHDREGGKEWRNSLGPWLNSRKALYIDPYNKPILDYDASLENDDNYQKRIQAIEDGDYELAHQLTKPFVHIDLRVVDKADALIVNLDKDKYPCGSFDELFMARGQNKPTIIHCPQGIKKIHHWLWGRIPYKYFFETWDGVKEYLRHIDEDEVIDDMGEWKFFDLEDQIRNVLNCQCQK